MGRMPRWAYLWPGLPQLWMRGAWSALALAVAFTVLVNLALAASLVWTDWFGPNVLNGCWGLVLVLWVASVAVSLRRELAAEGDETEDLFHEVYLQYLQGNWLEAERLLGRLVGRDATDADARLMLATLKRHTGRLEEAGDQLRRLERLENAAKWQHEIARERELLAAATPPPAASLPANNQLEAA